MSTSLLSSCDIKPNLPAGSSSNNQSSSSSISSSSESSSGEEEPWIYMNPENDEAQPQTLKNIINSNNSTSNNTTLYRVTGIVQIIQNNNYGNFDLVDDSGYIYVYGCSSKNTSIKKTGNYYSYSSSSSGFSTMKIQPGDKIMMEGLYQYYTGAGGVHQFQGYVVGIIRNGAYNIEPKSYTEDEPSSSAGSYYSSISDSDSGSSLATKLHNLMDSTHTNYVSYSSLFNHYKSSDPHPSGNIKCFYSGENVSGKGYNREHVWAQSLSGGLFGEDHAGSDLHHVRPARSSYNSLRSNAAFGPLYGNKNSMSKINYQGGGASYTTRYVFEPADSIKGDVARIIMYVYVHYSTAVGGASQEFYGALNLYSIMAPTNNQECINILRKWNAEDPVSQDEITRNNYAYSVQNNRNPFIDHPKYADRIWG